MNAMTPAATDIPAVPFSWTIFLTLLVILGASVGVFWLLLRRWISQRQWSAWAEWARGHQFRLRAGAAAPVPPPLAALAAHEPQPRIGLSGPQTMVVQIETDTTPASRHPGQAARWNVLVREVENDWPPTGLRPAANRTSLLDLYALSSYPSLLPPQRFVVFGTDSVAARVLAASSARALLPADVGLMLHGHHLVLDFSARPFDPIEAGRMIALADQIQAHLPAPAAQA